MATLLLQNVGSAVGGMLGGPIGAILGRAAGGLAGAALDNALFSSTSRSTGPRLDAARIMQADEGAGIPRVYGSARIAGQILWATRFEEEANTERRGGKGGPPRVEVTTYSYYGNFALGLCEGPIAGIRRIWADGEEIDRTQYEIRVYRGTEDQDPDPLIEARQGEGNAPAYRGLAYLVFERLPLDRWGNRIPQMSCEVLRPIGRLETDLRAVTIIPGASEHGLDPEPVREAIADGEDRVLNRNVSFASSDWNGAIDEMSALMPNLSRAALVVSWFASDLRAGHCEMRPGVEIGARDEDEPWHAGGCDRSEARLVSRIDGAPAYGGTPSDAGVLRAIADLRQRGLAVTYYPFLLMDIPAGNRLPDPYGGATQAPFPWRGRLTVSNAESRAGSPDGTARARDEIERFVGTARPGDFEWHGAELRYNGPEEWSYRRMILHQAHLARRAGVSAFVIGSELRGLTRIRDETGGFPFVEALIRIAGEVKVLMPDAIVTYAADWSEYAGYRPADGSGDVFYNLDPLWACEAIDVVGIDNYLPLSDWRDEGAPDEAVPSPYDAAGLAAGVAGGEWFDWYYASEQDREAGLRTPITDGAFGKPFVYRDKDIRTWWSSPHVDRTGGAERGGGTAWIPMSKPIWFTEIGCPAIDRGANQPNVFVDPKSSESLVPHHSRGFRDDLAQRRFLEAALAAWRDGIGTGPDALNPISPVYGAAMVEVDAIHVWTWDARPYPAFPQRSDLWTDGANWRLGHWLNGRLANAPADALVAAILRDHGIGRFDVSGLEAIVSGYVIEAPRSARDDIEAILSLVGASAFASNGTLRFRSLSRRRTPIALEALVDGEEPVFETQRTEAGERPDEIAIGYQDPDLAYQTAVSAAARANLVTPRKSVTTLPVVLDRETADRAAARILNEATASRESVRFSLPPTAAALEPGDYVTVAQRPGVFVVDRIESGGERRVDARLMTETRTATPGTADWMPAPPPGRPVVLDPSRPALAVLDLPLLSGSKAGGPAVALAARPFVPYSVEAGLRGGRIVRRALADRPAVMGRLVHPLARGVAGRLDRSRCLDVRLASGALSSVSMGELLNGANVAALVAEDGRLEIIQFLGADEIGIGVFRLSGLLRGQAGTDDGSASEFPPDSRFVLLGDGVCGLDLAETEIGQDLEIRVAPTGRPLDDPAVVHRSTRLGLRAVRPLSPVHLDLRFAAEGAIRCSWIRRTRIDGDSWEKLDVPLGEESERYRVSLVGAGVAHTADVDAPSLEIPSARQIEIFGQLPEAFDVEVGQVSPVWGLGSPASASFRRPAH